MIIQAKLEITEPVDHTRAHKVTLSVGDTVVFSDWEHHLTADQKALTREMVRGLGLHSSRTIERICR